ncbi:hypothetical protein [Curtobacterium sp. 9128]|uniref:hypothetical protein n=1 Tax=Curtobacterium sp. 9128 TaxID=1793722 RepID=UPI0011A543F4|nr:hypothetical protein [Curtobacterium sp. 9128]
MDAITIDRWWTGPDSGPFAAWVADRCSADPVHCVRVAAVGRRADGALVVHLESLHGTPLPDALDRIGGPTVGVAVTLTVPLLDVAVQAVAGSLVLGTARADDVLVDDAGAPVLVDRPPGSSAADGLPAATRSSETSGATALLHAARTVWERVDPRSPCRAQVDAAFADAIGGGSAELTRLVSVVRATAPPRPVRWEPPADVFAFVEQQEPAPPSPGERLGALLGNGVPLPGGGRIPVRRLLIGVVVAVGVAAAGVFAISSGP